LLVIKIRCIFAYEIQTQGLDITKNKNKMITIKLNEKSRLFFIGARTNTAPNVVREVYKKVFGGNIGFLKNNDLENWLLEAHKQTKEIDNRNKMKII
jgi:hypothetical protein